MALTYSQWYDQFGTMFQQHTGYSLKDEEAAYYLMYQDPQTKEMKSALDLVKGKDGEDYSKAIIGSISAGTKFYVMGQQTTRAVPLTLGPEGEPQFNERQQKPSRLHRFLNTITFGQAYKQEITSYKEQEAVDKASEQYFPTLASKVHTIQNQRENARIKERRSVSTTLENRVNDMKATEKLMQDLLGPNSKVPDHLRNIPANTPEGKITAKKIGQTLQGIADNRYYTAPAFDAKKAAVITLGAAMLDASIVGVDISGSSPAGLDYDPQVNIRKNQRIMLIENTLALNGRDAIRNAGVFEMIANGRAYTDNAMKEYLNGNIAPIAAALRQVIETCTENWNTATDLNSNRTRVNGMLIADAMEIVEQNDKIKAAAGLTEEQMNRAKAISGVMQIYKEGQEALQQLTNVNLSDEQKKEFSQKAVASAIFCSNWQQESKAVTNALMEEINAVIPEEQITERMTSQSIATANRRALIVENSIIHMGVEQTQKHFESVALKHPLYQDLMKKEIDPKTLMGLAKLNDSKLQRSEQDLAQMLKSQRMPNITYQRVSTMAREHEMEASKGKGN